MSCTKPMGVNAQAWREFCRAEQLLAQRDELLAALKTLAESPHIPPVERRLARAAIAKATEEQS